MAKRFDWMPRVEAATVRLAQKGGQGILVPGGFVLTATHCIEWDGDGGLALGDHHPVNIETKTGAAFRLELYAAEARADIAVLGELDNQQFGDDCAAFEAWREATEPVALSTDFEQWRDEVRTESFRVHAFAHTGEWVEGRAERVGSGSRPASNAWFEFQKQIHGGTSGGPIVDDAGRLVSIVSTTSLDDDDEAECNGLQPVASWALPRWVLERIRDAS